MNLSLVSTSVIITFHVYFTKKKKEKLFISKTFVTEFILILQKKMLFGMAFW